MANTVDTPISKYTKSEHEASHKILWQGNHLDGKLTVVYCGCCNEEQPSDIPDTVTVDFTLVAADGTEFAGFAAISMTPAGVLKLLDVIDEAYMQFLLAARKEQACIIH